jgi:hypothetical protein
VQISLAHRSKTHTIIKTHGDVSEGPLEEQYLLVVSNHRTQTRWPIKATGLTTKRKCKCAISVNGQHGMNPTGRCVHMFEEEEKRKFIETTTEILIKKK